MRRIVEKLLICLSWCAAIGLVAILGLLVGYLLERGMGTLKPELFFGDASMWKAFIGRQPVWDGIWPAVVGTFSLVAISSCIAVPLGIAAGIYLAEYAADRWKAYSTFAIDLLAGLPSIVMGLFGFSLILLLRKSFMPSANTCLLLSAGCLALLVLPYLIRTTQTALEGIPPSTRVVGLSLGFTQWQNIVYVLLPAAGRGVLSGVILAIGRSAEDTAVILLTGVVANAGLPRGLTDKYEALPFSIYYLAAEHRSVAELNRGFGAALVLLVLTSVLFLGAYWLRRTVERKWS